MNSPPDQPSLGSDYKDAKRDRRRGEILDAAATVFAQKGYFATTMQDIAEILGMRPASLYYYVTSKEAALEEVCRRGGRTFVLQLQERIESGAPVFEIIESGIRVHLDSRWRDYVASFAFNRQNLPDGVLAEMNTIARTYSDLWVRILERGMKSKEISPDLDAKFAAGAILAICNNAATAPDGAATDTIAKNVFALLMNGIRKS